MFVLYLNNDLYKRLDSKTQEILKQVIAKYNLKLTAKFAIRNEWALAQIKNQRGKLLQLKDTLPLYIKNKLFTAWNKVLLKHLKNSDFKKIADSYYKHHKDWVTRQGDYYKSDTLYKVKYDSLINLITHINTINKTTQ